MVFLKKNNTRTNFPKSNRKKIAKQTQYTSRWRADLWTLDLTTTNNNNKIPVNKETVKKTNKGIRCRDTVKVDWKEEKVVEVLPMISKYYQWSGSTTYDKELLPMKTKADYSHVRYVRYEGEKRISSVKNMNREKGECAQWRRVGSDAVGGGGGPRRASSSMYSVRMSRRSFARGSRIKYRLSFYKKAKKSKMNRKIKNEGLLWGKKWSHALRISTMSFIFCSDSSTRLFVLKSICLEKNNGVGTEIWQKNLLDHFLVWSFSWEVYLVSFNKSRNSNRAFAVRSFMKRSNSFSRFYKWKNGTRCVQNVQEFSQNFHPLTNKCGNIPSPGMKIWCSEDLPWFSVSPPSTASREQPDSAQNHRPCKFKNRKRKKAKKKNQLTSASSSSSR